MLDICSTFWFYLQFLIVFIFKHCWFVFNFQNYGADKEGKQHSSGILKRFVLDPNWFWFWKHEAEVFAWIEISHIISNIIQWSFLIQDYSVSETTLEQIFLGFARSEETTEIWRRRKRSLLSCVLGGTSFKCRKPFWLFDFALCLV